MPAKVIQEFAAVVEVQADDLEEDLVDDGLERRQDLGAGRYCARRGAMSSTQVRFSVGANSSLSVGPQCATVSLSKKTRGELISSVALPI